MSSPLEKTITQIRDYNDPTPRITEVYGAGEAELFLGDARVEIGELVRVPATQETMRVRKLCGQRVAIAGTLDSRLEATPSTPIELPGTQARLPAPRSHVWRLARSHYVSEEHGKTLPAQAEPPSFDQLDGARALLPTGFEAIDLLSPLARGGVNLVIDNSPDQRGYEALRERVERELGHEVTRMTVREEALEETPNSRQIICADESHEAFYAALRVATVCVQAHRDGGDELFFFASLPVTSSHEAWQRYGESGNARSGSEMSHGEVISWLGDHLTSTRSARVTTLLTLSIESAEGDLSAIIDTMALGDVDALVILDEQGFYDPRSSRSRTPLPHEVASKATRVRGILHRASLLEKKLHIFGDDELSPEELADYQEASTWTPRVT